MTETTLSLQELLTERTWLAELARSLVRDDATAADLSQETWLSALGRSVTLATPRAWLATVARNHARQRARAAARRAHHERQVARTGIDDAQAPDEVVEHFETQRKVAAAVHALDEPFKTTLLLHYYEGLGATEIARRTGVPAGTVRWRLHRAHALVRAQLEGSIGRDWRTALLPICGSGSSIGSGAAVLMVGAVMVLALGAGWLAFDAISAVRTAPVDAASMTDPVGHATGAHDGRDASMQPRSSVAATPVDAGRDGEQAPAIEPVAESQHAVVRLRVVDRAQRPVAGATITIGSAEFGSMNFDATTFAEFIPTARTGTDGSATLILDLPARAIARMPEGRRPQRGSPWTLELVAHAPRHADLHRQVRIVHGDVVDLGDLLVDPTAELHGRVVDARGKPVAGARIGIVRPPITQSPRRLLAGDRFPESYVAGTTSRSEPGMLDLDDLATGPVLLLVALEGVGGAFRFVRIADGVNELGELALVPSPRPADPELASRTIRVHVLDAAGRPLESAQVFHRESNGSGMTRTGRDGIAELDIMTVGNSPSTVALFAADGGGRLEPSAPRTVPVETAEVEVRLNEARKVAVTLHCAQGAAPANAFVGWRVNGSEMQTGAALRVDATHHELPVPPFPAQLVVTADGFAPVIEAPRIPAAWPGSIDIKLRPLHRITGIVRAAGQPVAKALVTMLTPTGPMLRNGFRSSYAERLGDVLTGDDGRFALDRPERGRLAIQVTAKGFAPDLVDLGDFDPALARDDLMIDLDQGVTVSGTLRDARGLPVVRRLVALNGDRTGVSTVLSDLDGGFRFLHVGPGRYELRPARRAVDPDSYSLFGFGTDALGQEPWTNLEVRSEDVEHDVVLDLCTLHGSLSNQLDELDFRGWTASLSLPHDDQEVGEGAMLDASGAFTLSSFAAGEHRLRLRAPGGAFGEVRMECLLDLAPGSNTLVHRLELTSARGAVPSGTGADSLELTGRREGWSYRVGVDVDELRSEWTTSLAPVGPMILRNQEIEVEAVEIDRR